MSSPRWQGSFPPRPENPDELPPTLGPHVVRWATGPAGVRLGDGDWAGQPMVFEDWQTYATYKLFELWPIDKKMRKLPPSEWRRLRLPMERRYRKCVVGLPKGSGKGPWAAAMSAAALLGGPVMFGGWTEGGDVIGIPRVSPIVSLGACSLEQANLVYSDLTAAIGQSPALTAHCDIYGTTIKLRDRPGSATRVSSNSKTTDGMRSSDLVLDEVHEAVGPRLEHYADVVSGGLMKRTNSLSLFISTAGAHLESLLGTLYLKGKRINAGELRDDRFLFLWWEADPVPADFDWDDDEALAELVRACNPSSFMRVDDIVGRRSEIALWKWRRYHLNQWVESDLNWLPPGTFEATTLSAEDGGPVRDRDDPTVIVSGGLRPGERIVAAVDGSLSKDATVMVAASLERPYLQVLGYWHRPPGAAADWKVPIVEVEQRVRQVCGEYATREVAWDPNRWQRTIETLGDEGLPMAVFSQTATSMGPATERLYTDLVTREATHDGDPRLAEHLRNAVPKETKYGTQLTKQHPKSPLHIDLAVAAVMAWARRNAPDETTEVHVWDLDTPLTDDEMAELGLT